MRLLFRSNRIIWFMGVLLLVGTAAGAGWVLNHPQNQSDNNLQGDKTESLPPPFGGYGIAALGYVDVLPGVANLMPLQPGRVVWVASEGTTVEKGQPVLKLDDEIAKKKLSEAMNALEDAKLQRELAELGIKDHANKVEQQKSAIKIAKEKVKQAELELLITRQLYEKIEQKKVDNEKVKIAQALVDQAKELVEVENRKLDALKLAEEQTRISIERAKVDVQQRQALVEQAKLAVDQLDVKAPADGKVLRVNVSVGEVIAPSLTQKPAVQFCPNLPRIVRAEVQQEFASNLEVGQEAIIEDDTTAVHRWQGKVIRISDWYAKRRSIIDEPFQFNDVRTLECIIEVTEDEGHPLRIGQRMRVLIKQGGP